MHPVKWLATGIGKPLHITAHTFRYSRCIIVQTICHSIGYALIIPPPVFALQTLSWSQIKITSTLEPRSIFQIRLDEEANPWSHDRLASMLANEIMQLLQKSAIPPLEGAITHFIIYFLSIALNGSVKKFNQTRVNDKKIFDSLKVAAKWFII